MAQNTWLSASLDNPTWSIIMGMHLKLFEKVLIKLLNLSKFKALLHDVLIFELEQRFPNHELMNVLEIIFPQY
jgi:hypothetical protein